MGTYTRGVLESIYKINEITPKGILKYRVQTKRVNARCYSRAKAKKTRDSVRDAKTGQKSLSRKKIPQIKSMKDLYRSIRNLNLRQIKNNDTKKKRVKFVDSKEESVEKNTKNEIEENDLNYAQEHFINSKYVATAKSSQKKEHTKSTTAQSKDLVDKAPNEGSKRSVGQKSMASQREIDEPERQGQSGQKPSKQLDKITIRSIQDLFLMQKNRDASDSSLTEHSDRIIKSIKKLGLLRKNGSKEHKSDSIILDLQKQSTKPEKVPKSDKKKQKLKMILGRGKSKQTHFLSKLALTKFSKEVPCRQTPLPNPGQPRQIRTRPGSPNKQASKLMKLLGKSGRKHRMFTLGSSKLGSKPGKPKYNSTTSQSPNPKVFRFRNNSKKGGSGKQPNL